MRAAVKRFALCAASVFFTVCGAGASAASLEPTIETIYEPASELTPEYDEASSLYLYTMSNGSGWKMNVPVGGITDHSVAVYLTGNSSVFTYSQDGEEKTPPEDMVFREKGRYRMTVVGSSPFNMLDSSAVCKTEISFLIGSDAVNEMEVLNAPSGFVIQSAQWEKKPVIPDGEDFMRLKKDGRYRVIFQGARNQNVYFLSEFLRDTTPPFLHFSQPVETGRIRGEVTYTTSEDNCNVAVYYENILVDIVDNRIAGSGHYSVTVTDQAGNGRTYLFQIEDSFRLRKGRAIILFAFFCGAAVWLMVRSRKNMQIL